MKTSKEITLTWETKRTILAACQIASGRSEFEFSLEVRPDWLTVWCKDRDNAKVIAVVNLAYCSEDEIITELFCALMDSASERRSIKNEQ